MTGSTTYTLHLTTHTENKNTQLTSKETDVT